MRNMNERILKAVIGHIGDTALKIVSIEYLNDMIEHPGVYEIIQWAGWNGIEETASIYNEYTSLLNTLISSCELKEDKYEEILNMLTGIIHGYTTQQLRYAFANPEQVRTELNDVMDTVLIGVHLKYGK